ncbi:hypothetical protein C1646_717916 [Rhizophagus diaphanus]|nr:hypothetical protein C1646_717916 [Rhizophagus diaphanus] [Rhizophagus sp. MUCL 43196]
MITMFLLFISINAVVVYVPGSRTNTTSLNRNRSSSLSSSLLSYILIIFGVEKGILLHC